MLADGVPLYALPTEGGTPVRLDEAVLFHSDFVAPQPAGGGQVAIIAGAYRAAWTRKTLRIVLPTSGEGEILTPADQAASSPAWSPDGQRIAYVAMSDQGDLVGGEPARQGLMQRRLWVASVEGEPQAQQLTSDPAYRDEYPLWSANGSHILFARLNAENQASLWLIPVKGGEPLQVVKELTPTPEWFGYYGHIDWDGLFDWWTGPPQTEVSALTVEEYPIVVQEMDTPSHFEYFRRIPSEVLERRRAWREPSAEKLVESCNTVLIPFGYRLVLKRKPGWDRPFYDLYQEESLLKSDLDAIWPVSVNDTGDDFALLVEELNGPTFLVRREAIEKWDQDRHCYMPPIFVGDDLVAVEVDEQHERYVVRREGKMAYNFTALVAPGPRADNPVKGLWSWDGHWVLEVDGQVIMGGQNLNQDLGYAEIFGWRLLKGQPFYFFRKDNHIGISYAGQALSYQYDEVIHYRCCEPAAFNVFGNETMVWFHALRDGMWYYVEMGIYGEDQG
ncbi:MAG: hypothetical protein QHJ74_17375 [Anaerolineae bacterium]|nr:hypothetical protein [Anaerolineae bacterium]